MKFASKKWICLAMLPAAVILIVILRHANFFKHELSFHLNGRENSMQHIPEEALRPRCPYRCSYGIYLVETNFADGVTLRGACVVESASIKHPARDIFLLHTKKIGKLNGHTAALLDRHFNVRLVSVDLDDLFLGTPLQRWHETNQIGSSQHHIAHLSDAMRLAVLYRCGGIYLDTDALPVRSLSGLRNAIGYSSDELNGGELGSGTLIFDQFHPYLNDCMTFLTDHYSPDDYSGNGPQLVSKVMRRYCGRKDLVDTVDRPQTCRDVTVMAEAAFYPFPWLKWKTLFRSKTASKWDLDSAFVVHLYAKASFSTIAKPGTGSLLEELAREHCPMTYKTMVELGKV